MKTVQKLLFVSHLYPNAAQPTRAVFNHELMKSFSGICEVKVIAPYFWFPGKKSLLKEERLDGINILHPRILYIPRFLIHMHWRLYRFFVKAVFAKAINDFQPDHVMLGFIYPDAAAMGAICREKGVDYSVRVNGSDFYTRIKQHQFRDIVMDELIKAPKIFCPGEALKDAMVREGVEKTKITSFDNGVDSSVFKYRGREEVGELLSSVVSESSSLLSVVRSHDASRIVLFVGNLVPVKNPEMLMNAFARVAGQDKQDEVSTNNHQLCLVIIGDGSERRHLEVMAERAGLSDRILFLGSRPHNDVALWMNIADCLCLCSKSEGMPNVVVEALTCGLPVVATDVGECGRLLGDDPNSRVVPVDDVDKAADALAELLNLDIDRESAAKRYSEKFSWDIAAETVCEALRFN